MSVVNAVGDAITVTSTTLGPGAGAAYGSIAAGIRAGGYGLWQVASGLILASIGASKQYTMYSKMALLTDAQAKAITEQQERTHRITDEYMIPQLKKAQQHFWGYSQTYGRNVQDLVVECATAACEYTPSVRTNASVIAKSALFVTAARRGGKRTNSLRQGSVCHDQSVRYAMVQGAMTMSDIENYVRYEENRTLRNNQFLWNKLQGASTIAMHSMSLGANMVMGAASGVNGALQNSNQLLSAGNSAVSSQMGALGGQANVFGGLGALGGQMVGSALGSNSAAALAGSPPQSGLGGLGNAGSGQTTFGGIDDGGINS